MPPGESRAHTQRKREGGGFNVKSAAWVTLGRIEQHKEIIMQTLNRKRNRQHKDLAYKTEQ